MKIDKTDLTDFKLVIKLLFINLDYRIESNLLNIKDDYIVQKEEIQIVIRILYKEENTLVSISEIEEFNEDLFTHYNLNGYLITNTKFDLDYSNNLYLFDKRIRLFDRIEIERLTNKNK
jgi:hypothetical protein